MLVDGVEEIHAERDQPPSAIAEQAVAERQASADPRTDTLDPGPAPFFVRVHSTVSVPSSPTEVDSGTGRDAWMDAGFRSDLRAAGLDSLEAVMASSQGRCMRALADRENWRLELTRPGSQSRGIFLKKHHVRTWTSRVRALIGSHPGESAGRVEAENVGRLRAIGIESMRIAAWGERLYGDGRLESFLMTEELDGYLPLEEFLAERFPPLETAASATRDRDLLRLIDQVADVARRFHLGGYNHRDFYCCHFFVKESPGGRFEIRLIDLQRVQHRVRFRRRWLVKDLAQLSYSASRRWIKSTHRVAFMRRYFGVKKLQPSHKRMIRRVLAKQRRMERKLGVVE